jgi:ABC-type transport system involved in multi-copper enzyme maturation permease subunit
MAEVREKGYHHWEGQLEERRPAFWPIARTGVKLAFERRRFKLLFALSFVPAVTFAVGIYISERLEDFQFMAQGAERTFQVNPAFFKSYLTMEFVYFMILLLMSLGGAGLIADDFRNRAVQLYFARPIRKLDYLLGKAGVVMFFVGLLTMVPAVVLLVLKLLFSGSFKFFLDYPWLILSIIFYSLFLMIFFTAFVLLASSLNKNRNYVIAIIFAVFYLSEIIRGIFSVIFRSPYSALLSFRANLQQVGAGFFLTSEPYGLPWYLSFIVICLFCLFAYYVVNRKVRGVEVIK